MKVVLDKTKISSVPVCGKILTSPQVLVPDAAAAVKGIELAPADPVL